MNKKNTIRVIFFIYLFILFPPFLPQIFAGDVWSAFERLKHSPILFQNHGQVCEKLVKASFEDHFYNPSSYTVITGIGYAYSGSKQLLGELDVVVFRKDDRESILVAEVKCWIRLHAAHNKAMKQLNRFYNYNNSTSIDLWDLKERVSYPQELFDEQPQIISISQKGGENFGFDATLDLDLNEVKELYRMLVHYQSGFSDYSLIPLLRYQLARSMLVPSYR